MSAASLDATVARAEFDSAIKQLVERMTALESTVSQGRRPGTRGSELSGESSTEVVTQNEFRLFKWLGTFALAAVLAGFVFLYEQTADLRVDIERQHRDLLKEMNAQYTGIRGEIGLLRERVTGVETRLDGVETRLGRVETRLDGVETRLDGVETRLGRVETRLDGVETHLGRVETRLDDVDTRLGRVETRFSAPT